MEKWRFKSDNRTSDLIILDLMLPKWMVWKYVELRLQRVMTPILMLTAKMMSSIGAGLELGADDYMTKPFSPREVVARVKAILRRTKLQQEEQVTESSDEESITIAELKILPGFMRLISRKKA